MLTKHCAQLVVVAVETTGMFHLRSCALQVLSRIGISVHSGHCLGFPVNQFLCQMVWLDNRWMGRRYMMSLSQREGLSLYN